MELFIGVGLGVVIGFVIGIFFMACISINKINESDSLAASRTKSLKRAEEKLEEQTILLRKYENIVQAIQYSLQEKEPSVITLGKITRIIKE